MASDDVDITAHNVATIGRISTDVDATVRLYSSAAARTADARALGSPVTGSVEGLIAEVALTASNLSFDLSPTVSFINLETVQTDVVFARVFNQSGGATTIDVSITCNFGD